MNFALDRKCRRSNRPLHSGHLFGIARLCQVSHLVRELLESQISFYPPVYELRPRQEVQKEQQAFAFWAPFRNCSIMPGISSSSRALGITNFFLPSGV